MGQVEVTESVDRGERVCVFDERHAVVGQAEVFERTTESQERSLRDGADAVSRCREMTHVEHGSEQFGR